MAENLKCKSLTLSVKLCKVESILLCSRPVGVKGKMMSLANQGLVVRSEMI